MANLINQINAVNNASIATNSGSNSNGNFTSYRISSSRFAQSRIKQILEENNQEFVIFNGEIRFTQWS